MSMVSCALIKLVFVAAATLPSQRFKIKKAISFAGRFCDNVWTFMLNDVEFRDSADLEKVDRVKVSLSFV